VSQSSKLFITIKTFSSHDLIGVILLFICLSCLFFNRQVIHAQDSSPAYWRYDAPGRLSLIEVADVNHDGIDDFIVVADDTNIVLVGADGRAQWPEPFVTNEPIQYVQALDAAGPELGTDEIVIATDAHLILISGDGQELWQRPLANFPAALSRFSPNPAEPADILIALENGRLIRFNFLGQIVREYEFEDSPAEFATPILAVTDLNRDGANEIIYSYLSEEGFSKLLILDNEGNKRWERSNSGAVTAFSLVEFDPEEPLEIAIATTLNRVYLYTTDGQRRWPYRSPNIPVTSLAMAYLEEGPSLLVGTEAGTLIAYDQQGRRLWSNVYGNFPEQPVLDITTSPSSNDSLHPVAIAVLLGRSTDNSEPVDVLLLDDNGQRLEPAYSPADSLGLSRLVDINHDGTSEILVAAFATLELVDPGIGARQYFEEWDYRLGAEPESVLVEDIDLDGEQEVLIGTDDGKLHALDKDGNVLGVTDLDGIVSHLAIARSTSDSLPNIVAVLNSITSGETGGEDAEGRVDLLWPDGRQIWTRSFPSTISSMIVGDINFSSPSEILIGTTEGQVIALSLTGDKLWTTQANASIDHLTLVNDTNDSEIIIGTGANIISRLSNNGSTSNRLASYLEDIATLEQVIREDTFVPTLIVGLEDGTLRSLSTRGNQNWQTSLESLPTSMIPANDSLYVSTDEGELLRINLDGDILWRLPDVGRITTMYWADLDGNIRPDLAVGNRAGEVQLITADGTDTWDLLNLGSELFQVSAIRRLPNSQAELVAVTDNGIVQLFRSQSNRPPLLVDPKVDVDQGKYSIAVSVIDVENDPVTVSLEIADPESGEWVNNGQKQAQSGNDMLFWPVSPPSGANEVRYRFNFDDGTHQGQVEPTAGPPPISGGPAISSIIIGLFVAIIGAGSAIAYLRQSNSPTARANRFLLKIKQQPDLLLELLEMEYLQSTGSPDFLLHLANKARQEKDKAVASLADGLFLLASQPESALPIISSALDNATELETKWRHLDYWRLTYNIGQALLTAPSITEISLLQPQLDQLVKVRKQANQSSEAVDSLLPVSISLRDSERVDLAEDRLVYLNEAIGLLKQLQYHSNYWLPQIENSLVLAIADRWMGLVRAEIEELLGRAQLVINLITKHLVPEIEPVIAINVRNVGRSSAEQIFIKLKASPTYTVLTSEQHIPILSPGRERQVQFRIEPNAEERFRIVFELTYNDRHGMNKKLAFADMVHFLPPVREFVRIRNPYSPGMPLRGNSSVFFGREDLFEFINQNAFTESSQTVLILVGQRRTGKTSALLRLDLHLPERFLPVYIDCQSLGVTPGMPTLFQDLAWGISDAFASRGYDLDVPDPSYWKVDPAGRFQRDFLEIARQQLPNDSVILLIFDEFETFENLVSDGILPKTIFTYLRHLMQHGKGLSFIFAGTHRLEEIGTEYWSVLFNSALYRRISFLSRDAAMRLVRDPVTPNIVYDDLALDKILRVTAGHPYFLQLVCYTLVRRANEERDGYITISDVNAALDEMLRLGEVHFAYLWQRSSYVEKALLAAVSRLMDYETPFRPTDLVQFLEQYSIHLDPSEVTTGLNRLVEREIMWEITAEGTILYELRIGLVGLWVAKNKSLSHLYEMNGNPEISRLVQGNAAL
jgi:outer membrane protein assembly factor BamB